MDRDLDLHLPGICARDTKAFARWMAAAEERIRLSLRSFARAVDTESVVQETMFRVWQVAPKFKPDGRENGLLRLAIRIARNLAISEARRMRSKPVEPSHLSSMVEQGPSLGDPLLRKAIRECADELPAKPKQAFLARVESRGVAHDRELAGQLSMTPNTFLKNIGRARQFLVECLSAQNIKVLVPR